MPLPHRHRGVRDAGGGALLAPSAALGRVATTT